MELPESVKLFKQRASTFIIIVDSAGPLATQKVRAGTAVLCCGELLKATLAAKQLEHGFTSWPRRNIPATVTCAIDVGKATKLLLTAI